MKKNFRYPKQTENYYSFVFSTDFLDNNLPEDIVFTNLLSEKQKSLVNRAFPYFNDNAVFAPIKKNLKIFLLDADSIGKNNVMSLIINIRFLNILLAKTYYVIYCITTHKGFTANFIEQNKDVFRCIFVPTKGVPNKVDNMIALELGSMLYEFSCSEQEADIIIVSEG